MSIISSLQFIKCHHNEAMYYYHLLLLLAYIPGISARTKSVQSRIVGGTPCSVQTYPYMVSVRVNEVFAPTNFSHYCGGTLINNKWVLSAAHCYIEERHNNLEDYLVVAGISFQSKYNKLKAQKSHITAIITKDYRSEDHNNDIALLKLKRIIHKSETVDYVTLPGNNLYPIDLMGINPICSAMGWGILVPIDPLGLTLTDNVSALYPDHLMCVNLPLIKHHECKNIFQEKSPDLLVTNTQMCTLDVKAEKDACGGDSGGPLMCNNIQQGITSWGLGCAQVDYPGVFTRIDIYIGWIKRLCKHVKTQKLIVPGKTKEKRKISKQASKGASNQSATVLCTFLLYLHINFIDLYSRIH